MLVPFIAVCLAVASFASAQAEELKCNGFSEFCDRKYTNLSFVGANNSPLQDLGKDSFQQEPVSKQLNRGVRFLSAEIYNQNGEVAVCHKYCTGTGAQAAPKCKGRLFDFLRDIDTFLRQSEEEIVTLRLINGDRRTIQEIDSAIARSGLKDLAFFPRTRPLPVPLDD